MQWWMWMLLQKLLKVNNQTTSIFYSKLIKSRFLENTVEKFQRRHHGRTMGEIILRRDLCCSESMDEFCKWRGLLSMLPLWWLQMWNRGPWGEKWQSRNVDLKGAVQKTQTNYETKNTGFRFLWMRVTTFQHQHPFNRPYNYLTVLLWPKINR